MYAVYNITNGSHRVCDRSCDVLYCTENTMTNGNDPNYYLNSISRVHNYVNKHLTCICYSFPLKLLLKPMTYSSSLSLSCTEETHTCLHTKSKYFYFSYYSLSKSKYFFYFSYIYSLHSLYRNEQKRYCVFFSFLFFFCTYMINFRGWRTPQSRPSFNITVKYRGAFRRYFASCIKFMYDQKQNKT